MLRWTVKVWDAERPTDTFLVTVYAETSVDAYGKVREVAGRVTPHKVKTTLESVEEVPS